jgi:imidazolonepropionase-like amidohydrolase
MLIALLVTLALQEPAADQNRPSGVKKYCLYGKRHEPAEKYAIRAAKILTVTGPSIDHGVILVAKGRIEKIGRDIAIPEGYTLLEFKDSWAMPGLVDLHAHIAATDWNDTVYQVNPEMRNLDVLRVGHDDLKFAVAGGVTTILQIPGSGSNMGGFGTLMKTHGDSIEDVLVRFPGALKIAQAGNPERGGGDLGAGRAGMNWLIRNVLEDGKRYHEAWLAYEEGRTKVKPDHNGRLENFRGLFAREFPVAVHTQIFQVVQSTMRICHDEMKLWTVTDHSTFDGYKNAPEFASRGIWTVCGPRGYWLDTQESKFRGIASSWHERGVTKLGINTDSPVVPQEDLFYQAAMNIRLGLPEEVALKAVTINAATAMGIDDRVGSLEAGKDADIVIKTGDPFDIRSWVQLVIINGKIAYDTRREPRRY